MKRALTNDVADFRSRNSKKFDLLERLQSFVFISNIYIYMLFIDLSLNNYKRCLFADNRLCVCVYVCVCVCVRVDIFGHVNEVKWDLMNNVDLDY